MYYLRGEGELNQSFKMAMRKMRAFHVTCSREERIQSKCRLAVTILEVHLYIYYLPTNQLCIINH